MDNRKTVKNIINKIHKEDNWRIDWNNSTQPKYYLVYKKLLSGIESIEYFVTYTGRGENTYMSEKAKNKLIKLFDTDRTLIKDFLLIT